MCEWCSIRGVARGVLAWLCVGLLKAAWDHLYVGREEVEKRKRGEEEGKNGRDSKQRQDVFSFLFGVQSLGTNRQFVQGRVVSFQKFGGTETYTVEKCVVCIGY